MEHSWGGFRGAEIAKALGAHVRKVERVRERCVTVGIEAGRRMSLPVFFRDSAMALHAVAAAQTA